jgi:ATP-dependent Lon protease
VIRRLLGDAGTLWAEISEVEEAPIADASDLLAKAVERFATYSQVRSSLPLAVGVPEALRQIRDPGHLADLLAARMPLPLSEKQALLATLDPVARLERVIALMDKDPVPQTA